MPDETAERLATLPRARWDEMTWGALGGAVAAFPSAGDAIISALQRQPFSLHGFETIQVGIFLGFSVWFLSRKRLKGTKTSGDLLNELRSRMTAEEEKQPQD